MEPNLGDAAHLGKRTMKREWVRFYKLVTTAMIVYPEAGFLNIYTVVITISNQA